MQKENDHVGACRGEGDAALSVYFAKVAVSLNSNMPTISMSAKGLAIILQSLSHKLSRVANADFDI